MKDREGWRAAVHGVATEQQQQKCIEMCTPPKKNVSFTAFQSKKLNLKIQKPQNVKGYQYIVPNRALNGVLNKNIL